MFKVLKLVFLCNLQRPFFKLIRLDLNRLSTQTTLQMVVMFFGAPPIDGFAIIFDEDI